MKHLLLSALLLAGLVAGCKKEEPMPTPLIVGTWQWGARSIMPTTNTGQIDPLYPPPTSPSNMFCTYNLDGTMSIFANGVTRSSGKYTLEGDKLTQSAGYPPGTYKVLELTDKRLKTLLIYQNGTARYDVTDYFTRQP
jgi:hypothetical protein